MSDTNHADLIAYCGLYCGDCFAYKGIIADYARDLRKELRQSRFEKSAELLSTFSFCENLKQYPQCYDVLGTLVKLRCKPGCKGGGSNPQCKIRRCCQNKKIDGCWECDDFASCTKLEFLVPAHGDAHLKNLRRLRKKGIEEFLQGKKDWYSTPRKV